MSKTIVMRGKRLGNGKGKYMLPAAVDMCKKATTACKLAISKRSNITAYNTYIWYI